jgi:hypothetical protein
MTPPTLPTLKEIINIIREWVGAFHAECDPDYRDGCSHTGGLFERGVSGAFLTLIRPQWELLESQRDHCSEEMIRKGVEADALRADVRALGGPWKCCGTSLGISRRVAA